MQTAKQRKAYVERLIARMQRRLLLTDWTISIALKTEDESSGDTTVLLDITPNENYRDAHLNVYPAFFDQKDKAAHVTHELMHLIVTPIVGIIVAAMQGKKPKAEDATAAEERTVSHLTHAFVKRGRTP